MDAFAEYPELKENIRSLHLWGCYTTTIGSIEINWKKAFPNVALLTGYDGIAPANDKPANWALLEDVLAKEKQLIEAGDTKKLKRSFCAVGWG